METLIPIVLLLLISKITLSNHITIENNAYKGIIVAFSPDIDESEGYPLIPKIQELFKSGSKALFTATRKRAYFSEVTILVPQSWQTKDYYKRATFENFGLADIRVDVPNPQYNDGPYTLQAMPCGYEGEFIHFTPNYLKNLDTTSTTMFGDPGKTLVHEWAHLRYGIFDEFGQPPYFPAAYYDHDKHDYVPNACANQKLQGRYWNPIKNRACTFDKNNTPEKNCVFEPDMTNKAESSMASYHFLPEMQVFCDGQKYPHNRRANNKQNLMCNNRNTWEIITSSNDFHENVNNPPMDHTPDFNPHFIIAQEMENTFSVVLDVSGSMDTVTGGYSRLQMARDVLQRWLKDDVKTGSAVGIVWFSTKTDYRGKMRLITNNTDRESLIKELPPKTIGSTCIGCGLLDGITQLQEYRNRAGGDIILLTDGEENVAPYIKEVIPKLVSEKDRVVTIAFTRNAGPTLMNLSSETGGKAYFVEEGNVGGLADSFYDAITYQTADFDLPVKVMEKVHEGEDHSISGTFTIDDTIGNDTVVNFQYFKDNDIFEVAISGPNVAVSSMFNQAEVDNDKLTRNIKFHFDQLKPAKYSYVIQKSGMKDQKITVSVKSKASGDGIKPITTRCWAEAVKYDNNSIFLILAEVKQGNKPVLNAPVVALVDYPNGKSEQIQLLDNGLVADVSKNDGIYSRFLLPQGKGKYAVKAEIASEGEASIQEFGFIASQAMPISSKYLGVLNTTLKPAGSFQRSAAGGALEQFEDVIADVYPPNKVQDLIVTNHDNENFTVEVQWTAPGNNIDYGNASRYDLRYSKNWDELFDHFEKCASIPLNLQPAFAGHTETLTIHAPNSNIQHEQTYFFAFKAYDDQNLASRMSNIVDVTFTPLSITTMETISTSAPTTSGHYHHHDDDNLIFLQVERLTYLKVPFYHHHHDDE